MGGWPGISACGERAPPPVPCPSLQRGARPVPAYCHRQLSSVGVGQAGLFLPTVPKRYGPILTGVGVTASLKQSWLLFPRDPTKIYQDACWNLAKHWLTSCLPQPGSAVPRGRPLPLCPGPRPWAPWLEQGAPFVPSGRKCNAWSNQASLLQANLPHHVACRISPQSVSPHTPSSASLASPPHL